MTTTRATSSGSSAFDPDLKKAQIAEAAIRVFAESGLAKAKMIEIAREANVGKGTIYEYFRSKDELVKYAVTLFLQTLNQQLDSELEREDDPMKKLEVIIHTTLESFWKVGHEGRFMIDIWADGVRSGVDYFDTPAMYAQYRALIGAVLDEGTRRGMFRKTDSLITASLIISLLDGMILQWALDPEALVYSDAEKGLLELLELGLAPND
ncbi:MAG: TetR/AcrR family transcriptional regulator [Rhodothermia bacterium]|nr:MAG: TetR/AcrR family transcriptional regulator [Rhodothermia bacterium]